MSTMADRRSKLSAVAVLLAARSAVPLLEQRLLAELSGKLPISVIITTINTANHSARDVTGHVTSRHRLSGGGTKFPTGRILPGNVPSGQLPAPSFPRLSCAMTTSSPLPFNVCWILCRLLGLFGRSIQKLADTETAIHCTVYKITINEILSRNTHSWSISRTVCETVRRDQRVTATLS